MHFRVMLVAILLTAPAVAYASKPETLQELIVRADAARPEERPGLYVEIAERQLKSADELYSENKTDEARSAINDVVTYSEKAHDAATDSGKRLKNTEIALRKMAEKLRDIKRTLNFDDQAPLQDAADRLEKLRTDLLSRMFSKGK